MKLRMLVASVFVVLILLPLIGASTTPYAPREFSPVQKGFVNSGQSVLPYAPDRIMVKFKESAMETPR